MPDHTEALGRLSLERDVIVGGGEDEGPLGQLEGVLRVTRLPGPRSESGQRPPQPALVAQSIGQGLGLTGMLDYLDPPAHYDVGAAGGDVQVDGLLCSRATFRDVPKRRQRLLEARGRLRRSRALHRLQPGLMEIEDGLLPHLASERVVRQALDVLCEPLGVALLDGPDGPGVEGVPAILKEGSRRPPRG